MPKSVVFGSFTALVALRQTTVWRWKPFLRWLPWFMQQSYRVLQTEFQDDDISQELNRHFPQVAGQPFIYSKSPLTGVVFLRARHWAQQRRKTHVTRIPFPFTIPIDFTAQAHVAEFPDIAACPAAASFQHLLNKHIWR